MNKKVVGYLYDSYPYKRNIIGVLEDTTYVKVFDLYRIAYRGLSLLNKIHYIADTRRLGNTFNDLNLNKVDILHFFNSVSYGQTPWVSTFETFIPRYNTDSYVYDEKIERALKAIVGESCKRIIALSECAYQIQKNLLKQYPNYAREVEAKMSIIHPPQNLLISDMIERPHIQKEELSFIFVGRDFFRKGGLEVLRAFRKLIIEDHLPIKLTIISSMIYNDYATKYGETEYMEAMKIIGENTSWITHYNELPNTEVLSLFRTHDVGLLPTWADTYGYSLLEMQACGCPVISTDIRAIPEINNDSCGWVIKVPKNELGEALYATNEEREKLSNTIQQNLRTIIFDIFNNMDQIEEKGCNSLKRIKDYHSPFDYAVKIQDIYQNR